MTQTSSLAAGEVLLLLLMRGAELLIAALSLLTSFVFGQPCRLRTSLLLDATLILGATSIFRLTGLPGTRYLLGSDRGLGNSPLFARGASGFGQAFVPRPIFRLRATLRVSRTLVVGATLVLGATFSFLASNLFRQAGLFNTPVGLDAVLGLFPADLGITPRGLGVALGFGATFRLFNSNLFGEPERI
jgi:hypothetical protein